MTVGIVLQARMGSARLPGKVMRPLAGRPMIQHIIARLSACKGADMLILATGDGADNDPLAAFVAGLDVAVFRGSQDDVLDRYHACAQDFGLSVVVRATGDNPFVDTEECERLIAFRGENDLDYASAFPSFGSRLPVGVGVEVMTRDALVRSWREGTLAHHREHVNEYIQEHPELFRQDTLIAPPPKQAPEVNLTVDTPAEFERAEALLEEWRRDGQGGVPPTDWLIAAVRRRA